MIRRYQGLFPTIPASCYVDISAQVIGDVKLGENSSVWMNAVLRGDVIPSVSARILTCRIVRSCTASGTSTPLRSATG